MPHRRAPLVGPTPRRASKRARTTAQLGCALLLNACISVDTGTDGGITPPLPGWDAQTGTPGGDAAAPPPGDAGAPGVGADASAPEPDAGTSPDDASAPPGDSGDAAPPPSDAGAPDPFAVCTAALNPRCVINDHEKPCGSLVTTPIPLEGGGYWGRKELAFGPYGAYIEWNEGKDFANTPSILEGSCSIAAGFFNEPDAVTEEVLKLNGAELSLYTIFRPACMRPGERYPVITWGNGTCGKTESYGALLSAVASHGFVVVASNSRYTGAGRKEMLRALDLAKAIDSDPKHVLYQHLDLEHVGAMGHSQGATATDEAAADPRVDAVILWNGPGKTSKPFLAVSAEQDVFTSTPASMKSAVDGAAQPGAWLYHHQILQTGGSATGHLVLMQQPERVTELAVDWWKYWLKGDATARAQFVGASCGLCAEKTAYEYGAHALP
jgi:Chlorophyllase enzyme